VTEADALADLKLYTAWTADPVLTSDELTRVLTAGRIVDAAGYAPADTGYTATYDRQGVYRAAAECWDIKATRAAERYRVAADGASFDRQQVAEACHAMARAYRARLVGGIRVAPLYGDAALVAGSVVP
jgi:hypothetical protein